MRPPLRVVVLASGEGTTLEGLAAALAPVPEAARIVGVISDRPDVPALERAVRRGLSTEVVAPDGDPPEKWAERLTAAIERRRADLVVLAGFLAILPPGWVARWHGRAVNLHPSLLPRYGGKGMHGRRVHAAVLAAGERETGATVHLVSGDVDGGPAVAQARLPVRPDDTPETLRDRLRPVEIELLARTVRRFADGTLPLPYPGGAEPARERAEPARRA
ncbi:MAG TPA: phosphoribosylglycinamide formyltransferase [Thermoplasmata archaeon]|nr:phosphoribosylglycinamide formyltransferase [Thermoplasmata archaeon]